MAVNRYTTVDWSAPTSSYIPKPFEQMMMVGKTMQKEHADKQTEADALANEINKIKVANEVISEGSGNDLGIKSRSTGYGEFKNEVLNKYTQANKQLSEDYQAGKLDSNQFSQKVNQLKNDFSGDYQKLKIAEANSAAIEESDKKYREAKHAGANPFVLNELAAEGARLRENPFQTSYKGAPIADFVDSQKALNDYAGNYQKQILNSGSGKRDKFGNIDYSSVSGVTKKRIKEGVTSTFDNDAIGIQTKSQVTRILRDQGLDWNSEVPLKDGTKVKAGDYYYNHMKQDFIDGVVAKAESSDLSKSISKDWMFERDLDKQDKEAEFNGPMPTLENTVQGSDAPLTSKSGLNWLGLNTDILNDDGSFNSKAYKSQGTDLIKDVKENINDGSVVVTDIFGNKTTHKTAVDAFSEFKKKPAPNLLTKYYTDLLNSAKGLGLEIPMEAGNKSKTDFVKLQKQLADYGQNMQSQGSTSAGFNARFANNLSDYFLGSVSADASGNVTFKKSPLLNNGSIIDQATGKSISENKEEIAQSGTLKGVNYFASDAGTYKLVSKGKSYNYHPGDQTLNAMTQNTHSLTQDIVKARQGKQNSSTVLEPATTGVDASGRVVNIPAKTVKTYADNIVNGLKENFKTIPANDPQGLFLANHLQENLNKLKGYEQVSVKTSDIVTDKNTPKYQYIAYQHKGFGTTSEADDKVLRIDTETGQTEVLSLGDIHASERDYLQKSYSSAFEQTKQ